jgi:carbon-monoxide dehydrogenase large subunit
MLTAGGRFVDDTNLPGQGYAYMVRSPHAHALIVSIDIGPAKRVPGVMLTGSDAERPAADPAPPCAGKPA